MMSSTDERPTRSMEDYLEAIAVLKERDGKATVTALSKSVGVKKPSVDRALKKLSDAGLVTHERYADVHLTPEGALLADEVRRRHKALFDFLTKILIVDPAIAEQDACAMEHALSRESIHGLELFISLVMQGYPGRPDGKKGNRYVENGEDERAIDGVPGEGP